MKDIGKTGDEYFTTRSRPCPSKEKENGDKFCAFLGVSYNNIKLLLTFMCSNLSNFIV